jgi:tRNA threonylcarbamoyladenosine biosynthesis protein TsaE
VRADLPLVTSSAEDTRRVGEALATVLAPGDVVSLVGDLGAGKTTLVQGAARGLGVAQPVVSPTFTLVREYAGTVPVYHVDVYRLERMQDVLDLGFEEMLDQQAVVFVEWGDGIDILLPESRIQVELFIPRDGDDRRIVLSPRGPAWAGRDDRLAAVTEPWAEAKEA